MFLRNSTLISLWFSRTREIRWNFKGRGALMYITMFPPQTILVYATQQFKFQHLLECLGLSENQLKLPSPLKMDSSLYQFLQDYKDPMEVQLIFPTTKGVLKNKAMQTDSMQLTKVVSNSNSIYGVLNKYKQIQKPNTMAQINNFITQYYLKMHGLHYLRVNNIPLSSKMTQDLKQKIFNHIKDFYQDNIMKSLRQCMNEDLRIQQQIQREEEALKILKKQVDRRIVWYKAGAITVTAIHVVSFTYMIFFVEWLGWDIIEPITYTVSVIYTLLGIRYFRKHQADRNDQSVKYTLRQLFSSPEQKAQFKQLQTKIMKLKAQQKTYSQEVMLLRNKLRFQTSLASAL